MTVLCIAVYNRIENIQHWINCLKLCPPVHTVVIHNRYGVPDERMQELCESNGITYIPRDGQGYDIGAFQDVCRGRIKIQYDKLLWCCDDCFPMYTDFVQQYETAITGNDVAAMQLSPYVRNHIRTTGFMITRDAVERLVFPADPITTKEHCYQFEHRDAANHFLTQVKAVQVAPNESSPMWDVGYHRRLRRDSEHVALFGQFPLPGNVEQKETVTFVCPIYDEYPAIISSLIMQSNQNWRLWLIHNGPGNGNKVREWVTSYNDDRVTYYETETYTGNWGHATRKEWLQKVTSKYMVITNPDNYYAPSFIEKCLNAFTIKGTTVAAYSSQMVHNYKDWEVITCRPQRGYIDCGGVVLKTKEVQAVGWNNITEHSADWLFFADIIRKHGAHRFIPVKGCLFVHN